MRVALGIAVFSGMIGVTIFGVFFTPIFYSVIRWLTEKNSGAPSPVMADSHQPVAGAAPERHDGAPDAKKDEGKVGGD